MRIPLGDVRACAECPAYFRFLREGLQKPVSKQVAVASSVLKRAYVHATESGFKMHWRTIIEHVDKAVFKDVDVDNQARFQAARIVSEHCLKFLRNWYYDYYMPEHLVGYADLPLEAVVGQHVVHTIAPLVLLSDHPIVVYVDDVEQIDVQMYNDIKARGLMWLVQQSIDCSTVELRHFTVNPRGGYAVNVFKTAEDSHSKVESAISQVCNMIAGGANYPSATEKCNNCPFRRRCIL